MVFMTFSVSFSVSGVCGVYLFFLIRLLSFSLSAELLEVLAGEGEGEEAPDEDSSWLVVFDVFELSEPAPATLLNMTRSHTPSTASTSS